MPETEKKVNKTNVKIRNKGERTCNTEKEFNKKLGKREKEISDAKISGKQIKVTVKISTNRLH